MINVFEVFGSIINFLQLILDIVTLVIDLISKRKLKENEYSHPINQSIENLKDQNNYFEICLNSNQISKIELRLKSLLFISHKNKEGYRIIDISKLIIALNRYVTKDIVIKFVYIWRSKDYVYWKDHLEPGTIIVILRKEDLIDCINSFKP